ncbi:TetR/AcrR family transcriptional regulator [Cohnella thermotolerans]|jgi:AcrR family transcriptional regulator|uniref:TetR/AcrR family transcriptional regulator n=1 Tax=Cohnella thermotolerans TaxID=329858 RepID=UPI000413ED87|nr:TetR/AcrR family transcriptional regulator [Cohnella thermotolerans]
MNREAKKKQTRARIIEAAIGLFERQGYEATTVQQITDLADVAKGTFFNYFTSKEDLILELQGFILMREIESKRGVPGPILPQLHESLQAYARHFPMTPPLTRAVLQGIYGSQRVGTAQFARSEEFLNYVASIIAIGQERGEIRNDMSADKIARLAVQCYYGVLMFWALEQCQASLEEQMAAQFDVFFDGIRTG